MTRSAALTDRSGQIPVSPDRPAAPPSPARRRLQLVLAGLWLLDGMLKLQPYMFTKNFAPMTLGEAGDGAPFWLVDPLDWAKRIVSDHPVGTMVLFALVEIAIGMAIAYRPTARLGLLACLCWVPFLWFFAEGLGGMTTSAAGPLGGAPGASILYGLLAVLLWPTRRSGPGVTSEAVRFVGTRAARIVWVALWGLLAVLSLLPANREPNAVSDVISANTDGAPKGYAWLLNHAASWAEGRGAEISITLAVLLALVAVSVLLPSRRAVRGGIVLAIVLATLLWVFAEGFGMPFMGMATDPDTGPLLAVIAIAFWPSVPAEVSVQEGAAA
ncbi:MAG TPA: hypothetical protein VL551_27710 [Actinospica sp.]|jgi:hypothetical protein|nr:hypothetical protein [Actinospica sp.]